MYHHTITYQVSQEKQRDMMTEASRERLARQTRSDHGPDAPRHRYGRRTWQLARALRAQAQS
jgi:hypothetical protein